MSRVSEIRVHRRRCLQQAVNSHELFWLQPEADPSYLHVYAYADAADDGLQKLRLLASVAVPPACTVKQLVAISPAPEFRLLWAVADCAVESSDEDVVVVAEQNCVVVMAVDIELQEMKQLDIITGFDQMGDVLTEQFRFGTVQEVEVVEELVVQILRVHGEELVLDEVLVTDKGPDLRRSVTFTDINTSNLSSTCIGQDHVLVATGEFITAYSIDGGGRQALYTLEGGEEVWRLQFQPMQLLGRFTPNLIYIWAATPHNLHLLAAKIGNQVNEFVSCGAVPLHPFVPPQAKTVLAVRNMEILHNSLGDGAAMLLHVFHEGTLLVHGLDLRRVLRAAELMRRLPNDPHEDLKPAYQLEELFRAELEVADIEQAFSTPHSLCTYDSGMVNDQSSDLSFEVRVLRQHASSNDYVVEVWRVESAEQQLVDFLREHAAEALANPKLLVPFVSGEDKRLFKQCSLLINPLRHAKVAAGGWSKEDGRIVTVYEAMLNAGLAHLICTEVERGNFGLMGLLKLWVTRVKADLVATITKPEKDEIGEMLPEFLFSGKLNRMRDFPMAWGLYMRSLTALSEGCSMILHALWERACADVADAASGELTPKGMAALNRHLLEVTALLACIRVLLALCEHVNFIYDHHKVRQLHDRRVDAAAGVQELGPTCAAACGSHELLFDKVLRLWGVDLGDYPPSDSAGLMALLCKPLLELLKPEDKNFADVATWQQVYLHCWAAVFYFILDVFSTTTPRHTIEAAREVMHNSGLPTGWQQLVEVLWCLDRGYPVPHDVDVYVLLSGSEVLEQLDSEIYDAIIVQLCRADEFDIAYRLMRRNPPRWNERTISLFTACASRSLPAQAVRRAYNDICRTVPANSRGVLKARAVTVLCEAPVPTRWANLKQLITASLDDDEAEAVAAHMDGLLDDELRGDDTDFPVAKLLISFMLFRRRIDDASRIVNRLQQARGAVEPTIQQLAALVEGYVAAANGVAPQRPAAAIASNEALKVPVTPNRKWRRTSTGRSQARTPQLTPASETELVMHHEDSLLAERAGAGNHRVAFDVSPDGGEDRPRQRYARTPFAFAPRRNNDDGNDDDDDEDPAGEQEAQSPQEPDSPMNIADRVFPRSAIKTPGATRRSQRQAVHFADDY